MTFGVGVLFNHFPERREVFTGKVRFEKGTIVVCPECCKTMAYAKRDIYEREALDASDWESDFDLSCSPTRCPFDNSSYYRLGKLHTIGGWK